MNNQQDAEIPTELSERITIPEDRARVSVKDSEGQMLAGLIREGNYSVTLEVGLAWGLSAAYMMSAHRPRAIFTSCDPREPFCH